MFLLPQIFLLLFLSNKTVWSQFNQNMRVWWAFFSFKLKQNTGAHFRRWHISLHQREREAVKARQEINNSPINVTINVLAHDYWQRTFNPLPLSKPPLPLTSSINPRTQQHLPKRGCVLLPSPGVTHESVWPPSEEAGGITHPGSFNKSFLCLAMRVLSNKVFSLKRRASRG